MTEADARRRLASQAAEAERRSVADVVIVNDGSLGDLEGEVERLWAALSERRAKKEQPSAS